VRAIRLGVVALMLFGTTSPARATTSPRTISRCNHTAANAFPSGKRVLAYFTAYDWWDNTPHGSGQIAFPGLHQTAGGVGTYANPITLAVGWCLDSTGEHPDYKPGTRFYVPAFRRYFRAEDECGDGSRPQAEACHVSEYQPIRFHQFDMWIDGRRHSAKSANAFMSSVTGLHYVIQNPPAGEPVTPGPMLR
jgi:hypothetical protein